MVTLTCPGCGNEFEARRGAATCSATCRQRVSRLRRKAAADAVEVAAERREQEVIRSLPAGEPIDELAAWSQSVLRVPAGHPLAGQPLTLPEYARSFLQDAVQHRESLLCMGRKNAKSALTAVYLLGRMVGPLRVAGWRGAVASLTKAKAGELKRQMEEIVEASGLDRQLRFRRSPAPGRVEAAGATLDILSADASSGHASGFGRRRD